MFERILERMRKLLRDGQYVVTVHAVEAMVDGTPMVVVGKIGRTRRLVILTVYLVEGEA